MSSHHPARIIDPRKSGSTPNPRIVGTGTGVVNGGEATSGKQIAMVPDDCIGISPHDLPSIVGPVGFVI